MVENPLIKVRLNTDYFSLRNEIPPNKVIVYTGPIDKFHNFTFGPLSWRTLDFDFEKIPLSDFQGCAVINYADAEIPWTRIHEFKHLHPERVYSEESTIIAREFSRFANLEDEPYYPINSNIDRKKLLNYRSLNRNFPNVYFGGRLGTYQYLDMHMAIASALNMFESELNERLGTN
jgi:UDP-galactopyranose mutase